MNATIGRLQKKGKKREKGGNKITEKKSIERERQQAEQKIQKGREKNSERCKGGSVLPSTLAKKIIMNYIEKRGIEYSASTL